MSIDHAPLRVITLWEPWASLVVYGAKPFEFRGKRPPSTVIGERVVIHAARRAIDTQECHAMMAALGRGGDEAAELCLKPEPAAEVLRRLITDETERHYGCGLGTAIVGEARDGIDVARAEFGAEHIEVGELQSNWAWPLTGIVRWRQPMPARGKQGIWFWPHDIPEGIAL